MTVKVAIVGAGFMGQLVHIPNFFRLQNCEVIALSDVREKLGRSVASKYHIPRYYRSHEELVDINDVDACVIAVADDLHAPIAMDLLRSGKHVFIEKPMATNFEDAQGMVNEAERSEVQLMIGYMKRYDPGCVLAKEIIDGLLIDKTFGRITYARVHCYGGDWICGLDKSNPLVTTDEPRPQVKARPPKWIEPEQYSRFLVFEDVFCHNVNLMRWFLGEPERILCSTSKDNIHNSIIAYKDFSVGFETGSVKSHFWDEEIKIYFEKGWIEMRTPPPLLRNVPAMVEVYEGEEKRLYRRPVASWGWSFEREAQHFIECVSQDREPLTNGKDSVKDIALIEELYKLSLGN